MISDILLKIIFVLLPTQLGKHFWPQFSYINGFRIDYFSPTIYIIDIFLVLYVATNFKKVYQYIITHLKKIFIVITFIAINVLFSLSPLNSAQWFAHLTLYSLFILNLTLNKIKFKQVYPYFLISLIVVIFLGLLQTIKQHSLEGLWYWLGERHLDLSMSQITKFNINHQLFLRPYSLFSHPNSFAGYLLLSYLLVSLHKHNNKFLKSIIIASILITGSKATILSLLLYTIIKSTKKLVFINLITFLIISLSSLLLNSKTPNFVSTRLTYYQQSISIISYYPIFGVGYGNYLKSLLSIYPNLSLPQLQPVHHTLLLLITEFGLLNLVIILIYLLLKINLKSIVKSKAANLLLVIIFLSQLDHYFYTLPQNKLLLLITLYFMVYNKKDEKNKTY